MSTFADADIFVLLDLATPITGFIHVRPDWNIEMFNNYTKTLDAFAKYEYLLAVVAGNEVINGDQSTSAAPYVKAAIRNIKAYRDGQGYREILVGYAAADVIDLRLDTMNYMICGDITATHVDFFGINDYSWCDQSTFTMSGYSRVYDQAGDYPVPIFFSKTDCNNQGGCESNDQKAVLGPQMGDR